MKTRSVVLVAALACLLTACSSASASTTVTVTIGYQSKTINTVTAGTLLKSLGYFEQRLTALGRKTGKKYQVVWQDYDTGAPITAQMVAGKIDIGSMGDYPMLINGSRSQNLSDNRTEMVSVTGYNPRGALNMVVVPNSSTATTLHDLAGQKVSTSIGSAAHGTLVHALAEAKVSGVQVLNQQPQVGASALQAGSVAALAQFVAWPGQLVFANQAKLLYDGGDLNVPTLHGVVARTGFASAQPDVLTAFLQAQIQATRYLWQHPLAAAESVASATGLAPEVVYLYNGPNGMVTFDPTLKPVLRNALSGDVPFLKSIGDIGTLDVNSFINDAPLRAAEGSAYAADTALGTNPAQLTGTDPICHLPVDNPATASETWLTGEQTTHASATPTCLLRFVTSAGKTVRAAYVPDASTGTRWFANKDIWVNDPSKPATDRLLPFTTESGAHTYLSAHPGSTQLTYAAALAAAR